MAVKILMLGGRRSGKSSILATIIHTLNTKVSEFCTIQDETDYAINQGLDVTLSEKRVELANYLSERDQRNNSIFQVDMTPNNGEGSYKLKIKIGGTAPLELEFIDVPGEWMENRSNGHKKLKDIAKECDIFLIAVDTPYMMQDKNPNISNVWNRAEQIKDILAEIEYKNDYDRKLIMFVPVKGEKWLKREDGESITNKLRKTFALAINNWVNQSAIEMWCLPVQTAGGLEHVKLMDAYRVFKSETDKIGELCSRDEYTGTVFLKNGETRLPTEVYEVSENPDKEMCISYTQIPLSWYKVTGNFKPKDCEQVGYQIVRFLVEKQKAITELTKKKIDEQPWFIRIFLKTFSPPLGKYLKEYEELLGKLLIKKSGNGFCKITEPVKID